jgi:hypothetical protein
MPSTLPSSLISRALRAAAAMPAPQARAVVRMLAAEVPLCCAAAKGKTLAERHYAQRKPVIAAMQSAIQRHLDFAKHETLRKLEKAARQKDGPIAAASGHGMAFDLIFDPNEFKEGLLAAMREESATALQTAGDQLYEELGKDDPWTMPDPKAKAFLDTRVNLLKGVPDEVHQAIEAEVKAGLDAGESLAKISKRISSKFDEIGEGRAATIASTETSAAYGFARNEGMAAAGITHKRWLTSHLPNVRDAHAEAEEDPDNQMVPIDEPFHVGGEDLQYPGDPNGSPENVINCHCIALAVESDEELADGEDAE